MFCLLSALVEILTKTTPGTSPGLQFVLRENNSVCLSPLCQAWMYIPPIKPYVEYTPMLSRQSYLQPVVISPPKVRGEQSIISVKKTEIICQLLHWLELADINKGVGRSQSWHISSIIHYRNHIVRQDIVKLLRQIILSKVNKNKIKKVSHPI